MQEMWRLCYRHGMGLEDWWVESDFGWARPNFAKSNPFSNLTSSYRQWRPLRYYGRREDKHCIHSPW